MNIFARLELRQRQALVITPQLQQAIKLLQLSAIDLQAYIDNELKENPLLAVAEDAAGDDPYMVPGTERQEADAIDVPAFDAKSIVEAEPFQHLEPASDYDNDAERGEPSRDDAPGQVSSDWASVANTLSGSGASEDFDLLASVAPPVTLASHLRAQSNLAFTDATDRFLADYLIDLVEADGYIRSNLNEVAMSLSIEMCDVERILLGVQSFDPPGVGARTLSECLALQLKEQNRYDPCMERLLSHLDLLAACDYQRLRKVCGVDAEDLEEMIAEIRRLNPRPGLAFETVNVETLVPDVIVRRGRDGVWQAEINPSAAPALAVDRAYYNALKSRCRSDAERSYLSDRYTSANWLAKSLDQRLTTIMKVATAVVEEQVAFFDHGVRHLKPLNLRQIATKIGMHESTVSRVTSNKAMATPRGIFEMKYFFTSAIAAAGASRDSHSSEAVRDRIKELIARERPDQVLSDDRIVALLQTHGIDIARRTVAKYREALRIPSSAARRRQKRGTGAIYPSRPEAQPDRRVG